MTVIAAMSIVANTGRLTHISASFCMMRYLLLFRGSRLGRRADGDFQAVIELSQVRGRDAVALLDA
jgi:hypothetical protein